MHNNDTPPGGEKYEMSDASAKGIVMTGIVLAVIVVGSGVLGNFALQATQDRPAMSDYEKSPLAGEHEEWSEGVRLQSDPAASLRVHLTEQSLAADSYGKVSEDPLIYHIPVDTAIDIIVHEGKFPEFKPMDAVVDGEEG